MNDDVTTDAAPLVFGIYPGGFAGGGTDDFVPNDPDRILDALAELQGTAAEFIVRCYTHFGGAAAAPPDDPQNVERYLRDGRRADLVLEYVADEDDMAGWTRFISDIVSEKGPRLASLTVSLEVNANDTPLARKALLRGVVAAKRAAAASGQAELPIGFSVVNFGVPFDDAFWRQLRAEGGTEFADAVDYVGVDLYAGAIDSAGVDLYDGPFGEEVGDGHFDAAFGALPSDFSAEHLAAVTSEALRLTKNHSMPLAGLRPSTRIRVTENGWPTYRGRTDEQQSIALGTMIRTIAELRHELLIDSYELFSLRDSNSNEPGTFNQLGILRDDYTPKPAYHVVKELFGALAHH
ncbi:hypothetical protein [Microbacterium sp.]|uniref:hypothetical protein n=1 Tax=Microbacterium sp. TaxID=51671 RepID=UPI003F9626AA